MKLFDSHCHMDDKIYSKDFDEVMVRADQAGVESVMVVGINKKSSQKAVLLAESIKNCYASTGVHPHDAKKCTEADLEFLAELAKSPKVRAWGETGLDFNRMYSPQKDQENCFIRQLEIAGDLHLPVIFHERDSNGRFFQILKDACSQRETKGVVHCFSGSIDDLKNYLDLGLYIGITGIITIKQRGEALRKLARLIPAHRLLIETDAPYLTPSPEKNRTRRNEPAFLKHIMLKLADIRKEDPFQLSETVWQNTCLLYQIDT